MLRAPQLHACAFLTLNPSCPTHPFLPPAHSPPQYGSYQAAGVNKPGWGFNEGFKYVTETKVSKEAGFSWNYNVRHAEGRPLCRGGDGGSAAGWHASTRDRFSGDMWKPGCCGQ